MSKNEVSNQVIEVNRICTGTEFHGTLKSTSDIRIDGFFEGKINTLGKLVIGEFAKLIGEATCKSCDIWGEVDGKIVVKEVFGLRKSGKIKGKVSCQKIFIEEGGEFNGTCKMITEEEFDGIQGNPDQQ
ncbi:MAG: hypothetical protein A2X19_03255 [Bacteroidetes bacterium GWE2_39_28]|jgi:cytoskeletal protein CcmA (bactofilin family)|nr:polymer-forming cytoskeletal protein [Bacteroidales bacterium]OFX78569.1 MAG: hypothetical protein A2X19_03255 [Bacteroidetes bacterium GWE2_39_28]OFY15601.1 MAG: hypothetical protein A2X16_04555 [Bacteroidetes bacterium GWF2_39_10]OFZ09268.1 MAG: hypothetical protein A2322_08695 [Bacteroidetes bacterium RIFOXYB2_FULL_39_7]OFZ11862.1 MAG: hypothetical protein A2465_06430 [Bacteroidetes bacterium RIFOXYC2_FULL_39_11]HCT94133.1 hypothetical protein [Rikenellaceae bacterium]